MRLFSGIFKGFPACSSASQAPAANGKLVRLRPPHDIHWLCACRLLGNDADPWAGVPMLCGLFIVVFIQGQVCMVLIITMGNLYGACIADDDCGARLFCSAHPHPHMADTGAGECLKCVDEQKLCTQWGGVAVAPDYYNHTGWDHDDVAAMCGRCVDPYRGYLSR